MNSFRSKSRLFRSTWARHEMNQRLTKKCIAQSTSSENDPCLFPWPRPSWVFKIKQKTQINQVTDKSAFRGTTKTPEVFWQTDTEGLQPGDQLLVHLKPDFRCMYHCMNRRDVSTSTAPQHIPKGLRLENVDPSHVSRIGMSNVDFFTCFMVLHCLWDVGPEKLQAGLDDCTCLSLAAYFIICKAPWNTKKELHCIHHHADHVSSHFPPLPVAVQAVLKAKNEHGSMAGVCAS